jgi:CheY-like chemotaxis protein
VQDNLVNQRILVKLLASLGCVTRTCNDGQECVRLFEADASWPDLVLMDVEMCAPSLAIAAAPC